MANIYDVAKRAGVSTATVSRAFSQPDAVAPATRRRVLAVSNTLGFTPNVVSRQFRTRRTHKIVVTVPDISNPFFSLILQGIEDAAQSAGYSVLLGDTQHDEKREERYAQMVRCKEADGLIFLGHRLPREAAALIAAMAPERAPVVNGCEFSPAVRVPSVHIDNAKAAYQAVDHLYALGHQRIGVVTGPLVSPLSRDRLSGAKACARTHRAVRKFVVIHGDFSIDSGIAAAERLLGRDTRPTAVFCFNDEMAIGVIEVARRLSIQVPDELSVVGFDDIRFAQHTVPPLTTIAQPTREIGERTVGLLLRILSDGARRSSPESITLPHRLVVRGSTAPPQRQPRRRASSR